MERFFEVTVSTKETANGSASGKVSTEPHFCLTWSRNLIELKKEKNVDGVFPLLTTDHDLSAINVLNYYKYQPRIEKRFSHFKSFNDLMPILFKKVERVEAMMFLCFLSLVIQGLIEREVRMNMAKKSIDYLNIYPEEMAAFRPTTPIILESFEGISRTRITNEDGVTEEINDNLSQNQLLTLDMLNMKPSDFWHP